jgi:NADH-quinone oxidoreductase subunit D
VQTELYADRVVVERLTGLGAIASDVALSFAITGPNLRATGVPYDVRRAHPYGLYDQFEFEVPVGTEGDALDRIAVRMSEIRQSAGIIEQALGRLPPQGPILAEDARVDAQPDSDASPGSQSDRHFQLVLEGIRMPKGEVYGYSEAASGELGFFLVSRGTASPHRLRIRAPGFFAIAALNLISRGVSLSDLDLCVASLNYVPGECDR